MEITHAKSVIEVEQSITPHYYQWLVRNRFVTAHDEYTIVSAANRTQSKVQMINALGSI